jgi:hypothetical protein
MEIADVRKRVLEAMDRAKKQSAERRTQADRASRAFDNLLSGRAVPLVRQIASILKAEGYLFTVFTPSASVRLMSDTSAEDFIEIALDSSGDVPRVVGRVSRSRGRRVLDVERTIASGDPAAITEEELLAFLMKELEPFVER